MKKATFEHSVDVLVKAYMNDTLQRVNCMACAVGNLVADACKFTYARNAGGVVYWSTRGALPNWFNVDQDMVSFVKEGIQQDATGYTAGELTKIEHAFEGSGRKIKHAGGSDDEQIFAGLMAVVDVLAEIHNIDLTAKEAAKGLFVSN